ncbi:stress-activated map kinase interacting protein 1-domain-containing protein [Pyronema omphalodes]|nr:stress-activated map kinase interacting protein 1-domain-containing protein [Pyronema omphalodes]
MSLLQNQDFVIYRIRSKYVQSAKDGVSERLIGVNPTTLNIPAFKNAGWGVGQDIKRNYSPPIPCGPAGEYFASAAGRAFNEEATPGLGGPGGDETSTLLSHFSNDSLETTNAKAPKSNIARRIEMHREEDDSSDMSDESDDEQVGESSDKTGQKIHFDFSKKELPVRPRAGSSPIRNNGPQVLVTSPTSLSKARSRRLRGGSHGDVDYKSVVTSAAADFDTIPGADEELLSSGVLRAGGDLHSDIVSRMRSSPKSSLPRDNGFDSGDESDASSTMSSDFMPTADSNPVVIGNSLSPPVRAIQRTSPAVLNALPPPIRPVSMVQPVSILSLLLKAKANEADSPLDAYRYFSGKGELSPIYLKIYIPFAGGSSPFEFVLSQVSKQGTDDGNRSKETTVADAIGFVLYKYAEDKKEPVMKEDLLDINRWVLRMVDDGEPDDDFPPLERTQPIKAYMVKRAGRGGRLAAANRETKLEGEFALCQASEDQYVENCKVTPMDKPTPKAPAQPVPPPTAMSDHAPSLGPSLRQVAIDTAAASAASTSTPRTGPSKILRIHTSTVDDFAQSISICVTTDTYIAEVLDQVCKKKHLDKSKYLLRVTGVSNVVAPLDRTVASLGERAELDLVRRRFVGASEGGLGDRPSSPSTIDSPNAPLIISSSATARSTKKQKILPPGLWAPDMLSSRDYLKFTVWRKAQMSFMSRHERILAIDGEYVHIMPSDQKTLLNAFESQTKTRSIHISAIIGVKTYRKAPSNFKIIVMRQQKETKRYDFEAMNEDQAEEVVQALKRVTNEYRMDRSNAGM